eukprot:NODE_3_length_80033_cov_0.932970.p56 type:complete len:155 gc:universal NODE_3_length_80033_cov_0.932970:21846-21382(-)
MGQPKTMIQFLIVFNKQGKLRLTRWFMPTKNHQKMAKNATLLVLNHQHGNIIEDQQHKLIYKRYASLYFCVAIEKNDNELLAMESVHRYVECLDMYFGNVCELDLIYNFHTAYKCLDELMIGGMLHETSKQKVIKSLMKSEQVEREYQVMESVQ